MLSIQETLPSTVYSLNCLLPQLFTPSTVYSLNCLHPQLFTPSTFYILNCLLPQLFTSSTGYTLNCLHPQLFTPSTVYSLNCLLHQLFTTMQEKKAFTLAPNIELIANILFKTKIKIIIFLRDTFLWNKLMYQTWKFRDNLKVFWIKRSLLKV